MVFVGVFETHELDFNLSFPGWGNGFGWAGWGIGQSAYPGAEIGSSRRPLVGGIIEWFRLLLGLHTALIPQSKFGLAVRPEVQLGPDPLVPVIKRQKRRINAIPAFREIVTEWFYPKLKEKPFSTNNFKQISTTSGS